MKIPMSHAAGLAALVLAVAAHGGDAAAAAYNPLTAFSITNGDPNGPWTYGYETTLGGAVTLFDRAGSGVNDTLLSWTSPNVDQYMGDYLRSGPLLELHPGPANQIALVRLTLPSAGTFAIDGSFADFAGATTDTFVLINGVSVASGSIGFGGGSDSFALTRTLAAGTTIDFAVTNGGNGYGNDSTLLSATISGGLSSVPEPSSLALLLPVLTGVAVVGLRLRRARRYAAATHRDCGAAARGSG